MVEKIIKTKHCLIRIRINRHKGVLCYRKPDQKYSQWIYGMSDPYTTEEKLKNEFLKRRSSIRHRNTTMNRIKNELGDTIAKNIKNR